MISGRWVRVLMNVLYATWISSYFSSRKSWVTSRAIGVTSV